jgi:hypothetical protein
MSYSYLFKYIIIGDTGACFLRCVLSCWEQCRLASIACLGSPEAVSCIYSPKKDIGSHYFGSRRQIRALLAQTACL